MLLTRGMCVAGEFYSAPRNRLVRGDLAHDRKTL